MVVYLSKDVPFRHLKLLNGDKVQFENGRVEVDEDTENEMDSLFKKRPHLRIGIVKVDKEAALNQAKTLVQQAAIKGGITSEVGFTQKKSVESLAVEMQENGANPETAAVAATGVAKFPPVFGMGKK